MAAVSAPLLFIVRFARRPGLELQGLRLRAQKASYERALKAKAAMLTRLTG